MRITIVQGAFLPVPPLMGGAIEKAWFVMARHFVSQGHTVRYFSRDHNAQPESEILDGIHFRRCKGYDTPLSPLLLKWRDLKYALRVRRQLPPADVIVPHTFWLPLLLRSEARGKVYVHAGRFPKGQMRLYRHCARIQTVSQPVAKAIIRECPDVTPLVKVIPYPLPFPLLARRQVEQGERFQNKLILYAGRIHPEKGLDHLVAAFSALSQTAVAAGWKLRLVGPWDAKHGGGGEEYKVRLEGIAKAAGGRVEFAGPVFKIDELDRHYLDASLFVYPSVAEKGESFGLAPLEAMARGCPVLVSGLECFLDFIKPGVNGLVFDHRVNDPAEGLRKELGRILSSPGQLPAMGLRAWESAAAYEVSRVAQMYLDDFNSLIKA